MDNTQNYLDDFMKIVNVAASATDDEGRSYYTPGYGGYGASELRSNMYQNFFSNFSNYAIQREVNEKNLELAEKENQWNLDMWHLNNEYNEPAQQVQRFKDAGMSTAGAVQASQGFASQPVQSANLANQQIGNPMTGASYGNPLSGVMSILQTAGSLLNFGRDIQQYRIDKVSAEKAEKTMDSDISGIISSNDAKQWALKQSISDFEFNAMANPYKLKNLEYSAAAAKFEPKLQKLALKQAKQTYKLAVQYFGFLKEMNEQELNKIGEEIKAVIKNREEIQSRIDVNKATQGQIGAVTENVRQDTKNKKQEYEIKGYEKEVKEIESILTKYGAPEGVGAQLSALVASGKLQDSEVDKFLSTIKTYLSSQGKEFNGTPDERNLFKYILFPSSSAEDKKDWYLRSGADWRYGLFDKLLNSLSGSAGILRVVK